MSKRNVILYLQDIKDSIQKIEAYTKELSLDNFINDEKTIDAVVRNIEIIGEAANNLPLELKNKYSDVPWAEIIGARNKMIHEYFGVDIEILWKTVQNDIPKLKKEIKKIESKIVK